MTTKALESNSGAAEIYTTCISTSWHARGRCVCFTTLLFVFVNRVSSACLIFVVARRRWQQQQQQPARNIYTRSSFLVAHGTPTSSWVGVIVSRVPGARLSSGGVLPRCTRHSCAQACDDDDEPHRRETEEAHSSLVLKRVGVIGSCSHEPVYS